VNCADIGKEKSKHTGFRIALEAQHNFRGAIPPRRNILSHIARILLRIHGEAPGQTKIADLQLAIRIDEEIAGLEITMQHVGRMDVF